MRRACELLREGTCPPDQIAEMTGYSSVSSFYRSFSEYHGCSPMAWLGEKK